MAKAIGTITITDVLPPGIFRDIMLELKRAKKLHPKFPDTLVKMTAIMAEEAGEAIKEANLIEDEGKGSLENYKAEVTQCAAMCFRILEALEAEKEIESAD